MHCAPQWSSFPLQSLQIQIWNIMEVERTSVHTWKLVSYDKKKVSLVNLVSNEAKRSLRHQRLKIVKWKFRPDGKRLKNLTREILYDISSLMPPGLQKDLVQWLNKHLCWYRDIDIDVREVIIQYVLLMVPGVEINGKIPREPVGWGSGGLRTEIHRYRCS